jgi:hydrogenase nickel incorporation protein HypA/HybF
MHELGVAQRMVSLALESAQENHAQRITQFTIEMSQAADESEDALRFHLETLARGTLAEGAQFDIKRVPARFQCLDCGSEFEHTRANAACPQCHSARVIPTMRDEFKLTSIDIE